MITQAANFCHDRQHIAPILMVLQATSPGFIHADTAINRKWTAQVHHRPPACTVTDVDHTGRSIEQFQSQDFMFDH
jgi:hypothetical protein